MSEGERVGHGTADGYSDRGVIGQALAGAARLYSVPPASVAALLVAGVVLGAVGDGLLRAPGPPGLNLSLWVASVAVAALALHRRAALAPGRERGAGGAGGGGIAAPLVAVFGALFVSADAVFAKLVANVVRFDFERIASHVLLFSILAWLSTGYLRGFLTGTELPSPADRRQGIEGRGVPAPKWLALGITEVATALVALDLLFLVFVIVQFRYLFGGDALVQITP